MKVENINLFKGKLLRDLQRWDVDELEVILDRLYEVSAPSWLIGEYEGQYDKLLRKEEDKYNELVKYNQKNLENFNESI